MSKFSILIGLIILFIFIPQKVMAHGAGFPPFFLINGKLSPVYPAAQPRIVPNPNLPQDMGPENYLINKPINFEIDSQVVQLILPADIFKNMTFDWDFGDGIKGDGLKNTHTYSKMGSYTLTIIADYHQSDTSVQLIESVLINVLPDLNYQLPQSIISVNGKQINDPVKDQVQADLNNKINFDSTLSKSGSSKITQYIWDFDDGTNSNFIKLNHRYRLPQYFIYPSLRVIDANGFISDSTVGIKNIGKNDSNNIDPTTEEEYSFNKLYLVPIGLLVLIFGGFLILKN